MKKRITALALAFVMVMGTVALADGAEKSITVSPMTLNINGQTVAPTKSDGSPAEVFAYDGATYVPVRYLSELLGVNVEWDQNDPGTVKLTGDITLPAIGGDGTYTGTAQGFGGEVTAAITVVGGKITACTLTGDKETPAIGGAALERLQAQILAAGSAEIDGVSGATMTSNAVRTAVGTALAQSVGTVAAAVKMVPGTYVGSAVGFRPGHTIDVSVRVSDKEILGVEVDHSTLADTVGIFDSVEERLLPRIVEHQSVAVDSITGATVSSNGVKLAVTNALKAALAAAGTPESAISAFQKAPAKKTDTQEITVDVLVVGLGGAGTAAAVRAAELQHREDPDGVSVLAIDKAGRYGGMASLTADVFAVNPEKFQAQHNGGEDYCDVDYLTADWLDYCEGDAKEANVRSFIQSCGTVLDWMVYDHDLDMDEPTTGLSETDDQVVKFKFANASKGLTVRRQGTIAFYDSMMDAFTSLGGKYMLETEGYELIYDAASGKVVGCKARNNADGTEYIIHADAVILATGGFGGNGEMEEQYLSNEYYPLKGSWKIVGMTQNTGEMIASAIDIGAGTYNIDMCPMVHVAGSAGILTNFEYHELDTYCGQTNQKTLWTEGDIPMYMGLQPNTLAVNGQGRRFASEKGIEMLDPWKAGPNFYSIFSSDQVRRLKEEGLAYPGAKGAALNLGACGAVPDKTPLPMIEEVLEAGIEAGFIYKADTLEELAAQFGADPAVLKNTVETYNGYCKEGMDKEFGKDPVYLETVGEAPYYAIKMASYCYSTCGALDVTEKLEVLKADGRTVIGGLYATGLDSMGVLMTNKKAYVTYGGVAEGYAYTSGYNAAESAVQYTARSR